MIVTIQQCWKTIPNGFHPPLSSSIRHQTIYRGLSMKSNLLGGLIFEYWNFLRISTAYIWYLYIGHADTMTPWGKAPRDHRCISPKFLGSLRTGDRTVFFFSMGKLSSPRLFFNRVLIAAYWCKIIMSLSYTKKYGVCTGTSWFFLKGKGGFTEVGLPDTLIVRGWSLICGCIGHGLSSCNWSSRMMSFCRASAY